MNKLNSKTLYREMVEYYGVEYKTHIISSVNITPTKYGTDKYFWVALNLRRTNKITPETNASDIFAKDGKYILYNIKTSLRLEARSYEDLMAKLSLIGEGE